MSHLLGFESRKSIILYSRLGSYIQDQLSLLVATKYDKYETKTEIIIKIVEFR